MHVSTRSACTLDWQMLVRDVARSQNRSHKQYLMSLAKGVLYLHCHNLDLWFGLLSVPTLNTLRCYQGRVDCGKWKQQYSWLLSMELHELNSVSQSSNSTNLDFHHIAIFEKCGRAHE